MNLNYLILDESDVYEMYRVLTNDSKHHTLNDKEGLEILESYFKNNFFGLGAFDSDDEMKAYAFIKHPQTRPETMTQVHETYRNKGVATLLRNEILTHRDRFKGNIVYSATSTENIPCIKSLLKSGYTLFDVTEDKHLQFVKVLSYK